jgi:hypothetical protein
MFVIVDIQIIFVRPSDLLLLKGKTIPVTGRAGPKGCEMPRLPHFLDIRLTDGGQVVKSYAPAALYTPGRVLLPVSIRD